MQERMISNENPVRVIKCKCTEIVEREPKWECLMLYDVFTLYLFIYFSDSIERKGYKSKFLLLRSGRETVSHPSDDCWRLGIYRRLFYSH